MGVQVPEGHLMSDHVHTLISIPPKYSVAELIEYLKWKSSIWIAQNVERLGEGVLRRDRQAERGDDPRLNQKSGDSRQGVGSVAIEARVLMKSHLSSQIPL
jgi:REP element-mobilizing transposase RayT